MKSLAALAVTDAQCSWPPESNDYNRHQCVSRWIKNLNIESRKIKKLKPLCRTLEQFNHSFNNQICVSVSGNPREKLLATGPIDVKIV
jgi:hypothetical protein